MTTLVQSAEAEIATLEAQLAAKKAALTSLQGSSLAGFAEKEISELGAFFKLFAAHIFPKSTPAPAPAPVATPVATSQPATPAS